MNYRNQQQQKVAAFVQQVYATAYNNARQSIKKAAPEFIGPPASPDAPLPSGSGYRPQTVPQQQPGTPSLFGRLREIMGSSDGVQNAVTGAASKLQSYIPDSVMNKAEKADFLNPAGQATGESAQVLSDILKARAKAIYGTLASDVRGAGNEWQQQFPNLQGKGAVPSVIGGIGKMIDSDFDNPRAQPMFGKIVRPSVFLQSELRGAGAAKPSVGRAPYYDTPYQSTTPEAQPYPYHLIPRTK